MTREGRGMAAADLPHSSQGLVQVEGHTDRPEAGSFHAWLVRADEELQPVDLESIAELVRADENFVWIDLSEFAVDDLESVAGPLSIDRRALHAAVSPWQRPQVDVYRDHLFVAATVARIDPEHDRVLASELDLVIGPNYLLSIHNRPLPFVEDIKGRASQNPELVRLDSAYMLYIVLDELLEHYEGMVETLEDRIEALEERALRNDSDTFLEDIIHLKRLVFALGRIVDQHAEVFATFLRPDFAVISGDEVVSNFRDLENRFHRLLDRCDGLREAVRGAFDIYVSHVSHRTNHVMKVLTVVSTMLLPAAIILSFFGTSFEGLPLYSETAFWVMVGSIALVIILALLMFRRWGWL